MSGVELIAVAGLAASAAQIIESSLKVISMVSEIYGRVKHAPNRIAQYTTRINQLIAACRAIHGYKNLDSPLIDDQLRTTFGELKRLDQALTSIRKDHIATSKSKRVWKTIVGNKEKSIVTCFDRLEKEKTALILCINVFHIQSLRNIGSGVDILVERGMANPFQEFVGTMSIVDTNCEPLAINSATSDEKTAIRLARDSSEQRGHLRPDLESGPLSPSKYQDAESEECVLFEGSREQRNKLQVDQRMKRQTFKDMTASATAAQYNGDENTLNAGHSYESSVSRDNSFQHNGNRRCTRGPGTHKHRKGLATGNSIQRNGNIGGNISDEKIRKRAGKELEREGSEGVRLDESSDDDSGEDELDGSDSDSD